MGYGEFGGGSVKWKVVHSDGDSGSGNKYGGKGKDKDPKRPGGQFTVLIDGAPYGPPVPVDTSTVLVIWTEGPAVPRKRGPTAKGSKGRYKGKRSRRRA
jgi:hypothetical protein